MVLIVSVLTFPHLAHAGFFDQLVNDAQKSLEKGVQSVIDSATGEASNESSGNSQTENPADPASTTAPATTPKPTQTTVTTWSGYDRVLVKDVQIRLNSLGFNAGSPDGIYGSGTRGAIESFQRTQGLAVDGQPSEKLLSQLKQAQASAGSAPAKSTAKVDSGWPEPTIAAMSLAAVHFYPELLDNELNLRRILLEAHPEQRDVVSNEFQWHKRKLEFKQQLLDEAKKARLGFEVRPWRESSIGKARRIELVKYDFDREAYIIKFSTGTATQVTPKMFLTGTGEPLAKYAQQVHTVAMPANEAERVASYFGGNTRRYVYPSYRIRAVGTAIEASRPTPFIEFVDDEIRLYALKGKKYASDSSEDFEFLASVKLPVIAGDAAATAVPSQSGAASVGKGSGTGVVANAEIDGIKMGMPISEAIARLKAKGYKMESLRAEHPIAGGKVSGKGSTADGAGWINVYLRYKDGVVFEYNRQVGYLSDRIPPDSSAEALANSYRNEFNRAFANAKYSYTDKRGVMYVDDASAPPYNRQISTPHARLNVSGGGSRFNRFNAVLNMQWKDPVGIAQ